MSCWLGVDVGGTKLLAVLVEDGVEVDRFRVDTGRAAGPCEVLHAVEAANRALPGAAGIGIGFPGLVDHGTGVARSSVMLDGWCDVPLAAQVEARTGLPTTLDNDANVAALAEVHARDVCGSLLFVTVGTGIGGALVGPDGALWRGRGGSAGEIGNTVVVPDGRPCWCGRRGCLNTVASGSAIERRLGLAPGGLADADAEDVEPALVEAGDHLGRALADAVQILDPSVVAVGGGVVEAGRAFVAAARERVLAEVFDEITDGLVIEPATAGWTAGAVGAALLAEEVLAPRPPRRSSTAGGPRRTR